MKRVSSTDGPPGAVEAYSRDTTTSELVFTAGQVALTPAGSDSEPDGDSTET